MDRFLAAAIQMNSSDVIADNIAAADALLREAVAKGAAFVALPENAFYMRREGTLPPTDVTTEKHAGVIWAQEAAKEHGVWILIGSIRAAVAGVDQPVNRAVLVAPDGHISASYDKLHLFDVALPNGHSYRESSQVSAGDAAVLAHTALGPIGLSICYDLRFPGLYRSLALAGAEMLVVPSAFTRPTGEAHWHVLVRARAIENACYVIAPAQAGTHPGGRETYGHSLIVDPWGTILAEADGDGPCVVLAEIDRTKLASLRAQLPVLQHHRSIGEVVVFGKGGPAAD